MCRDRARVFEEVEQVMIELSQSLASLWSTANDLEQAMGRLMSRHLDYADLYCQSTRYETWTVEDGIVREGVFSLDQGVGVRAINGEKTGFAYADQLDLESLTDAVTAARSIAQQGAAGRYRIGSALPAKPLYPAVDPYQDAGGRFQGNGSTHPRPRSVRWICF